MNLCEALLCNYSCLEYTEAITYTGYTVVALCVCLRTPLPNVNIQIVNPQLLLVCRRCWKELTTYYKSKDKAVGSRVFGAALVAPLSPQVLFLTSL